MIPVVFSPDWAHALGVAVGESAEYRESGASWTGPIVLSAGDRGVFLDLDRGECLEARVAGPGDEERARIILAGAPEVWIRIFNGSLDPFEAVFRQEITLEKGSMMELLPHTRSAKEVLQSAIALKAALPEEWSELS